MTTYVDVGYTGDWNQVDNWCTDTIGPWEQDGKCIWTWSGGGTARKYQFRYERDAMIFKLKWE